LNSLRTTTGPTSKLPLTGESEASRSLLEQGTEAFRGEVLALNHPANDNSHCVARKLGFTFSRQVTIADGVRDLLRIRIG
jgi:hypothetical protein